MAGFYIRRRFWVFHKSMKTAKTTKKSLEIIELIQKHNGAKLGDLEEQLELSRSTIYKHLNTLSEHGCVVKEGEFYHIGLKFLNLGEFARERKQAYRIAGDAVRELTDRTNKEGEFFAENDGRGIVVHGSYHPESRYEGQHSHDSFRNNEGTYYHLHTIAAGKAILAELPRQRIEKIIDAWGLPKRTQQTITEEEELFEDLESVRERGVAFADKEFEEGLRSVGRRVKGPTDSTLGAISISAPVYRFKREAFKKDAPGLLTEIVDELEEDIKQSYLNGL